MWLESWLRFRRGQRYAVARRSLISPPLSHTSPSFWNLLAIFPTSAPRRPPRLPASEVTRSPQCPTPAISSPTVFPGGGAEALPAGLYPPSSLLSWFASPDGYNSALFVCPPPSLFSTKLSPPALLPPLRATISPRPPAPPRPPLVLSLSPPPHSISPISIPPS